MIPGGVLVLHDRFLGIVLRYGWVARLLKISSIQISIYTLVTPFTISAARAFSLFFATLVFGTRRQPTIKQPIAQPGSF